MPIPLSFRQRLYPILPDIAAHFGTPFHIYDETGIRETGRELLAAFGAVREFREYFAVKALPNPRVLSILRELGFGFDCSSIAELLLSRSVGARGEDIMFTSNNTSVAEFEAALADGGCILNLDDISLLRRVPQLPDLLSFRYNPGARRAVGADGKQWAIIGNPLEAKFGVAHEQVLDAYRLACERGAQRCGLHTMLVSNELDRRVMVQTVVMLLDLARWIEDEVGIRLAFVNMGGGLGIPYRPEDQALNIGAMGSEISGLLHGFEGERGYGPALFMESGRYVTGPHGVLVTRVINRKETYRRFVGVDASMSALMRPGMYGAYHHIEVWGKEGQEPAEPVDVVGALCENNDKFAVQRALPPVAVGDMLVIHDTGAHGQAMGFNYNGRLRPQELLFTADGGVERIRRAETVDDYFATLQFEPARLTPRVVAGPGDENGR